MSETGGSRASDAMGVLVDTVKACGGPDDVVAPGANIAGAPPCKDATDGAAG